MIRSDQLHHLCFFLYAFFLLFLFQKFVYFSSFESLAEFERRKLFCLVLDPQKFLHSLVLTITLEVNIEHNSIPFFDLWTAGVFISGELWRFHISDDTIFPDIFRFYFISISVVIWARSDFSWLVNVPWSFFFFILSTFTNIFSNLGLPCSFRNCSCFPGIYLSFDTQTGWNRFHVFVSSEE